MDRIIIDVNSHKIERYEGNCFICTSTSGDGGVTGLGRTPIEAAQRAAGHIFRRNNEFYLQFVSNALRNSNLMELGL